MPICQVCDGSEFNLYDGFYYCNICNTQSQDIREEMQEDHTGIKGTITKKLSTPSKKEAKSAAKRKRECRSSTEIFTVVLKLQVDFLISQGVDSRIKDIVFQLWAAYLQRNELAFCGDFAKTEGWHPKLGRDPRVCDLGQWNESMKKKRKFTKRGKKVDFKKKKKSKKAVSDISESEPDLSESGLSSDLESLLSRADSELSYYTSDGEMSGMESDTSVNLNDSQNLFDVKIKKLKYSSVWRSQGEIPHAFSMSRMTMLRTVSFCYLGLCYLRNANRYFSISDIIRWLRECHFPYANLQHIIGEKLDLNNDERRMLRIGYRLDIILVPSIIKVLCDSMRIARFLDLGKIPSIPPEYLIHKYVHDLNLPVGFITYVKTVCDNLLPDNSLRTKELLPIAAILISLKHLFKLNDKIEFVISEKCREKNKDKNSNVFVFQDWMEHTKAKMKFLRENHYPLWRLNPKEKDVDKMYRLMQERTTFLETKRRAGFREYADLSIDEMQQKFKEIANYPENLDPGPELFPWSSYVLFYSCQDRPCSSLVQKDFRKSTLDFILHSDELSEYRNRSYWHFENINSELGIEKFRPMLPKTFAWLLDVLEMLTEFPQVRILAEFCSQINIGKHNIGRKKQ